MSAEFDFTPGLDFSSLSSVTQEQILQAIAQLRTLSNKGLVIIGNATPDVVNNPRYAGYVWLDNTTQPPIVKTYNTGTLAWNSTPVAAISVTTAMMVAAGATGGINIGLLKRAADGSADASKGAYIVRIDSAGQYCEIVSLDTALSGISGGIGLNRITTAAAAVGYYLGYDGAALAYKKLAPATDFTSALNTLIPVTCLSPGTATYLLRTNAAGTAVEWIATTSDSLFAAATITLDKLGNNTSAGSAAGALQVPQRNSANTATVWTTPVVSKASGAITGQLISLTPATISLAHGLGAAPSNWKVVLANQASADLNYPASCELDIKDITDGVGGFTAFNTYATSTNIVVVMRALTSFTVLNQNAGASGNLDVTKWKVRAYAWL